MTHKNIRTELENTPVVKCDCCQQYQPASYVEIMRWLDDETKEVKDEWLICLTCKDAGEFNSMVYKARRLRLEREDELPNAP